MTTLADFLLARIAEDVRRYSADPSEYGYGHAFRMAECEAKRQIVEPWRYDGTQNEADWLYGVHAVAHEYVLRLLAQPHSDHPCFRDEWRVPQ